jgi:hypothetical protein
MMFFETQRDAEAHCQKRSPTAKPGQQDRSGSKGKWITNNRV